MSERETAQGRCEVLADGGETPGVAAAPIDVARVRKVRSMIPSLSHDRAFRP